MMNNMFNIDDVEIYTFMKDHGMIDYACVRDKIKDMKREESLSKHPYKITQGKDGNWRTNVKDESYANGLRLIKKSTKDKLLDELVKYYDEGGKPKKQITFKDMYYKWRSVQDSLVSDNTVYKYGTDYERFFKDTAFENMPIIEITEDILKLFFHDTITRNKLTKGAFKKLYGYVNNTFIKSYREKVIKENPMIFLMCKQFYGYCIEIDKPIEEQIFTKDVAEMFFNNLHQDMIQHPEYIPNYAVEFASLTGMRVSEIVALKWDDIDFNKKYFHINKSEKYNRLTHEYSIGETKNKKTRNFPIDEKIQELLLTLKRVQFKYGFHGQWVFMNAEGQLHAQVVSSCIKNKCKQFKIPQKGGIHALRKTLNSNMRCAGVSAVISSSLLGNSVRVNNDYYTFDVSTLEDKADIIANVHACI